MSTAFKILAISVLAVTATGCGVKTDLGSVPPAPTSTSTVPVASDTRTVTTTDGLNKNPTLVICKDLPELNTDAPNTEVDFKSETMGIEVTLPYNEKWGSDTFKIEPTESGPYGVSFGPVNIFGEGGCGYMRHFHILTKPKRDQEKLKQDLIEQNTISEDMGAEMFKSKMENINGKEVIVYTIDGLCGNTHYEVLGPNFNYEITGWCNDISDESTATIHTVIGGMKFI